MAKISTLLFDMDGTLIDTEPTAARAIESAFKSWGIQLDQNDARVIAGRTWAVAFEFLFSKYKIPVGPDEAGHVLMENYRKSIEAGLIEVPGAVQAVTHLAKYFRVGLVSGSNRKEILYAMNQLKIAEHFEVILGAEDYPNSKPAPDGYLKALQMLGQKAENTLIFEDSLPGITSGRAAGAYVVAITQTNHFGHDISQAHHQIPNWQGINHEWIHQLALKL
jgi:HAD superfamily hydrolase (TIGR01509 family)